MIVAHLSDLHLGYQAYESSQGGGNLRERDVARAFQRAVGEIVKIEPDAIVVAGDVFDRPEPSAGALVTLARGLENLRSALPGTPVLMVAGARDSPRSWGDPGALAALDTFSNVEAATGTPRSVRIMGGRTHVYLLPHRSVLRHPFPEVRPDPRARWNILVGYGAVESEGVLRAAASEGEISPLRIDPSQWDYVAMGHEHDFRRVGAGVVYSGSLERVGPEPWTEAHRTKGFVVADLEAGDVDFREVAGRPVVALAPIRWDPERPGRMNERIREVRAEIPGGMEGKIVRLRLEGMGPDELRQLDGELLSSLRREAMHLAVEVVGSGAEGEDFGSRRALLSMLEDRLEAWEGEREALMEAAEALLSESSPARPESTFEEAGPENRADERPTPGGTSP